MIDTPPVDYAVPAPRTYFALHAAEREISALLADDLCIIDDAELDRSNSITGMTLDRVIAIASASGKHDTD